MEFAKFKNWLDQKMQEDFCKPHAVKSMKKVTGHKDQKPKGIRSIEDDLSKDYKGHIASNGDVDPYKLKEWRDKHTKDQNHGKSGNVGGNPRYGKNKSFSSTSKIRSVVKNQDKKTNRNQNYD